MPILVFFLIFLIGCSDCSQKSNSPQNNDPNPKHSISEIPLVLPEEPTPTIPDKPTTPPDKPKPPTPNENDKQKYEWIDITFADEASYDEKIKEITPICSFLIKDGFDNKHLSKVIIKNGNNEVTLNGDLYTDRGSADRRKLISKKIPPEYMGGSCLQIWVLKSEIKFVKNMSALFYLGKKVVSVDFSNMDISCLESMDCMFFGCQSLKSVYGLRNLNKSCDYYKMFDGCKSLTFIENVEQWNLDQSKTKDMFDNCPLLKKPSWYKGN